MKGAGAIFGKGDKAPSPMPEDDNPDPDVTEDEDMPGDDEVPPEFESAYDEYTANPSAKTAYAMIEACKGASEPSGGGLALLLGKKK